MYVLHNYATVCMYVHTYVCMYVLHNYATVCMYVHTYVCMYVLHNYATVCMYVRTYVCMYVCTFLLHRGIKRDQKLAEEAAKPQHQVDYSLKAGQKISLNIGVS